MAERKRYAVVGTGGRSMVYLDALAGPHRELGELVALCDPSPTRMAWHSRRLSESAAHPPLPAYTPDHFEQMIRETRPNEVIVTTPDYTHHDYATRAMAAGCDVICEKPMALDLPTLRSVLDAMHLTGRKLRITFNARYMPEMSAVRRLLLEGAAGAITMVDFSWFLDTSHGADYFRRWHREKDKSGGLLVHKASHHFDLLNWWIGSYPQRVIAMGDLKFYGRKNAESRGESYAYDRYTNRTSGADDPFAISLDQDPKLRALYLDAEKDSGYVRDRNVFGEGITIEDTLTLTARYRSGVLLSYSLIAYSPWEGLRVAITGTKGRVELLVKFGAHIVRVPEGKEPEAQAARGEGRWLKVYPMFGLPYDVPVEAGEGGHGGADPQILQDLFAPGSAPDLLGRVASVADGAASSLMGIAANESMRTGMPVDCDKLIDLKGAS